MKLIVGVLLVATLCLAPVACRAPARLAPLRSATDEGSARAAETQQDDVASSVADVSRAGPSPWSVEFDIGVYSKYVWRGFLVGDDPVVQGSVSVDYQDFSFNLWGNVDLTDVHDTTGELNEINLTLGYSHAFSIGDVPLEASIGAIAYYFPATSTPTLMEVYAGLSADVLLQPSISVYREVLDQDYTYAALDIGHTFDFGRTSLDLGAGVGLGDSAWHRVLYDVGGGGMHDFHSHAAWNIPLAGWTFSPTIWWSSLFRDEVRGAAERSDLFVVALIVFYSF